MPNGRCRGPYTSRNVPSLTSAPRTISSVKDETNARTPAAKHARKAALGVGGLEVGKTLPSKRNAIGIIDADANARRGQISRQGSLGTVRASPLLRVQIATDQEKRAK